MQDPYETKTLQILASQEPKLFDSLRAFAVKEHRTMRNATITLLNNALDNINSQRGCQEKSAKE